MSTITPTVTKVHPDKGSLAGDTTITVTGTGFGTSVENVFFGATAATVVTVTDTQITVTNPAVSAAASVNVTVEVDGNTSPTNAEDKFDYKLPEITSVSPVAGGVIGNTAVTITGKYFSGAGSTFFGATGSSTCEVISDTVIKTISPNTSTAGVINVQVNVQGQKSAITTDDHFNYKLPEITGLSPSASALAGDKTVTITGKYFTGAASVLFDAAGASNIEVISDSKITVTNPNSPTAGVIDVRVLVQGLKSDITTADQFTYSNALAPGVPILFFSNSPDKTYVQFLGDANLEGSYYDNTGTLQTLEANTPYKLTSIASGTSVAANLPNDVPAVLVKTFSGRLYINIGSEGLQHLGPDYIPAAGTSGSHNYDARYQYFEPTIKDSQLNVDLSYIDFTSISMSLSAFNAPHGTNLKQLSQSSLSMATATGEAAVTTNGSVLPASTDQLPSASFARVISPQLGASDLYHDFTHYLKTTLASASVTLKGIYVGTGHQPSGTPTTQAQSYDYTATFGTDGSVSLTPNTGSGDGTAAGVPTIQQGPGVGDGTTTTNMAITFDAFNAASGIYGCNTPYTIGSGSPTPGITNDFYGQVVGDLLAGLNFGYVKSPTEFNDQTIGSLNSTEWWGGTMPDGTVISSANTPGGQGIYFSGAQSNADDYNSYAGSIDTLTTGYGFPLQDRLGKNLLTMNTSSDPNSYILTWVDITPVE